MPRFRSAHVLVALMGLTLALALTSCSNKANVLARVGDFDITVDHFNDAAKNAAAQYGGPPDSAKALLLDDLVRREMMVQAALRDTFQNSKAFQEYRFGVEHQMLREALYNKLVAGPFDPSEAEIAELARIRGEESHAHLIFTFTRLESEGARKAVESGEDFAAVANRLNPPRSVPPGGDIGFVAPGSLLGALDDSVRTSAVGRLVGPVDAMGKGWFIMKVTERRKKDIPPLESQRATLFELLKQRKQAMAADKAIRALKERYHVKLTPGAGQTMVAKLRALVPDAPAPGAAPSPLKELSDADKAVALASFDGGKYTMGEVQRDLANTPNRPNFSLLPLVERWIEQEALDRVALLEAKRRHLDQDPALKRRLRELLNNHLLESFYAKQVLRVVGTAPGDIEAAFAAAGPAMTRMESAKLQSASMKDSALAAQLAQRAGDAPTLREAAATVGAGVRVKEETVKFPTTTQPWSILQNQIAGMQPHQIAGPYNLPTGWLVFQFISKSMISPTLATLTPAEHQQLEAYALEVKREARLNALSDSLRKVIKPITVYKERLAKIPWPPVVPNGPPGKPPGT